MGAQHIGEALKHNAILKYLHLLDNGIGDIGAQHLSKAFESSAVLDVLSFHAMASQETSRRQKRKLENCGVISIMIFKMIFFKVTTSR